MMNIVIIFKRYFYGEWGEHFQGRRLFCPNMGSAALMLTAVLTAQSFQYKLHLFVCEPAFFEEHFSDQSLGPQP